MNIEEIFKFLEAKQIELENFGMSEETAFQVAITYLTEEEVRMWHDCNNINK